MHQQEMSEYAPLAPTGTHGKNSEQAPLYPFSFQHPRKKVEQP